MKYIDNTLTELTGEIDLSEFDVFQAVLVCESFNGDSFWVLDEGDRQLIKLNKKLEVQVKIENLGFLFDNGISPSQMFEKNDLLYILFPYKGLAIFDVFGTFLKVIKTKSKWINVNENILLELNDSKLSFIEMPLMDKLTSIDLPHKNIYSFQIQKNKLYLQTKDTFYIYSIKTSD